MTRILLHICCASCAIFPVSVLREEGFAAHGFFFNPNIQPYTEFQKRLETLDGWARAEDLPLIVRAEYDPQSFFRQAAFREAQRCIHCYSQRLNAAASLARRSRFDAFTSTLLCSRRQKHDLVVSLAEEAARRYKIPFLYRDFRVGWKQGQERAKSLGLYRQQYCGCIYSEHERYVKKSGRKDESVNG